MLELLRFLGFLILGAGVAYCLLYGVFPWMA